MHPLRVAALRNLTKVEDMLKEELYMFGDLIIVMVLTILGVHLKSILGNVERSHVSPYPKSMSQGLLEGLLLSTL